MATEANDLLPDFLQPHDGHEEDVEILPGLMVFALLSSATSSALKVAANRTSFGPRAEKKEHTFRGILVEDHANGVTNGNPCASAITLCVTAPSKTFSPPSKFRS